MFTCRSCEARRVEVVGPDERTARDPLVDASHPKRPTDPPYSPANRSPANPGAHVIYQVRL